MSDDTEQFSVSVDKDPKFARRTKITSGISIAFWIGQLVGFLICLSILGVGQQMYNDYPSLFYKDNLVSLVKRVWMMVDWKAWIFIAFSSTVIGVYLFDKLKRRTISAIEKG